MVLRSKAAGIGGGSMQIRREKNGYEKLEKALLDMGHKVGKTGWFSSAKYIDGTSVASVAAQNEYGNPAQNIPARPFFRPTITAKQTEWTKAIQAGALAVLAGDTTAAAVMQQVASLAASEIAETITKIWIPPLAPATIAARLRKKNLGKVVGLIDKPLIESKIMFNTLSGVVEDT